MIKKITDKDKEDWENFLKNKKKNLNKNSVKNLYKAYYKNVFFHFNNSFDKRYIKIKLLENYGQISREFTIKSRSLNLKKFDDLNIQENICFIKIDVEGFDHLVLYGMKNVIKKFLPVILVGQYMLVGTISVCCTLTLGGLSLDVLLVIDLFVVRACMPHILATKTVLIVGGKNLCVCARSFVGMTQLLLVWMPT